MVLIKKKIIQVFSDGSLYFNNSLIRKVKKVKAVNKDHINFSFNKKTTDSSLNPKEFEKFKAKYFKF